MDLDSVSVYTHVKKENLANNLTSHFVKNTYIHLPSCRLLAAEVAGLIVVFAPSCSIPCTGVGFEVLVPLDRRGPPAFRPSVL